MMQFQNQFEATDRATPWERIGRLSCKLALCMADSRLRGAILYLRKHFTHDDPCAWTPGRCEEENVDANKDNLSLDDSCVATTRNADNANDELANYHASSAPDEEWTSAEFFDGPE